MVIRPHRMHKGRTVAQPCGLFISSAGRLPKHSPPRAKDGGAVGAEALHPNKKNQKTKKNSKKPLDTFQLICYKLL